MTVISRKSILISAILFLSFFTSCTDSKKFCKELYARASKEQFDLVIVPGAPFENNKWGRTVKGRVYWAKFLFDKGIAKNVMFSGSSVYSPYYESMIMAMYAEAIGIPKENIFTETKAEHTTENVYYSYKKATELGFKKIAFASDPFQTKMIRKFTRKKVSPDIMMIPFVVDTLKVIEPHMIDPEIDAQKAFNPNFISIRKRQSLWKRLRGTMGKNIDWSESPEAGKSEKSEIQKE